jgi:hypothetical protein
MLKQLFKVMLAVAISSTAMVGADVQIGTWVLNTAKSKWHPGPIPKSQIITIWREGDWTVLKVEGTDSSGQPVVPLFTRYKEDDEAHPIDNGTAIATVRKISDYEYHVVEKNLNTTSWLDRHNSYSKDGKVRTSRVTGVNPKGEKIDRLLIFDRR